MKKINLKILKEDSDKQPDQWLVGVQEIYLQRINITMKQVQANLKVDITGKFDAKTFKAISAFQEVHQERIIELGDSTPVDQIYGPLTHRAYLESIGNHEEAEKFNASMEQIDGIENIKYDPTSMESFDPSSILIVGDSTAVGLLSTMQEEYTGQKISRSFSYKNGGSTKPLPTYERHPVAIGGARTGLVLSELEDNIESIQKNLGHDKLEKDKKLMIISVGGNDSNWLELQINGKLNSNGSGPYDNSTKHTSDFTFNNIRSISQLGEKSGYKVRIVKMRSRSHISVIQHQHATEVNLKLRSLGFHLVNGDLPKKGLSDAVHATSSGSKTILSRSLAPKSLTMNILKKRRKLKFKRGTQMQRKSKPDLPKLKDDVSFLQKVKKYAENHNANPEDFIAIMYHETGTRELLPWVDNNGPTAGGCVGLIQFCPGRYAGQAVIGKTGSELKKMTRSEQWDYVEIYLDQSWLSWKKNPTMAEIYMAIFLPEFSRLPDDAVLASSDPTRVHPTVAKSKKPNWISQVWKQNPANRSKNDNSIITKKDMGKNIALKPYPKNLFSNLSDA